MNDEKVYIEGREVGSFAGTLGSKGKKIHLINGDIVDVDDSFIIESIEPQKVVVPQFVADWIEVCKEHLTHSLYTAMTPNFMKENGQSLDLILWIKKASNQDIFARAWLDGYEVEKEKRYTVVMKETKQPLYYNAVDKKLFFSMGGLATQFTRKQLEEANFGWVFNCPGIEIKEVTE